MVEVKIRCEFNDGVDSTIYQCEVANNEIFNGTRVSINSAHGDHQEDKLNDNVTEIFIKEATNLKFFPSNLDKVFIHLIHISVWRSDLLEITQHDLKPFVNLKTLDLNENKIKILTQDVFKYNQNWRKFG